MFKLLPLLLPLVPGNFSEDPEVQGDWPAFLGPHATGEIDPDGFVLDWPEGGPSISWRLPVGPGYGGAAVRDGEVFLLDNEPGLQDILRVFDLESGEPLWSHAYPSTGRVGFPGPRCVPAVGEQFVVTIGPMGHVCCVSRETHEEVWRLDLIEELGGILPVFGFSASPLFLENESIVVVPVLGDEIGLIAFDVESGNEVWATASIGFSHSSPVLLDILGAQHLLMVTAPESATGRDEAAPSFLTAIDPMQGELLWQAELELTRLPIPMPVRVDDEHLFLTGGYRSGSVLLKLVDDGGLVSVEEKFRIGRGAQVHTPILHRDHLYLVVNENWNDPRNLRAEGGLLCLSLEGEELWRTGDDPYLGRGSLVRVGERLLSVDGRDGTLRLIEASSGSYQLLGEANLLGIEDRRDHNIWAPLAVSGGRFLLRTQDELICIQM